MANDAGPLRVLVCNDDGPPGHKSEYILPMVRAFEARGWDTHVCIPAANKSWSGKSIDPYAKVTVRKEKYSDGHPWWICEGGSPASAANIGLHHGGGSFDLVISGPNFGRNSSSCFATSSGTVAAALEGALAGIPAISLSFDTNMSETKGQAAEESLVKEGCELVIDLIWHLHRNWPKNVEFFNINVPLAEGRAAPIVQTTLERAVRYNSLYRPMQESTGAVSGAVVYEFACSNVAQREDISSAMLTDTLALNAGKVSVTPLLATFAVHEMSLDILKDINLALHSAEGGSQPKAQTTGNAVIFSASLAMLAMALIVSRRHTN